MRPAFAFAFAFATLGGCAKEEPLPLEPPREDAAAPRKAIEPVTIPPHVYERFTQADLVSAANSRFGTVDLNLAQNPQLALRAAREAKTYLDLARAHAEASGESAAAGYERRAGEQIVSAAEAAAAGDGAKAAEALGAARRALDLAIEQVNSTLVPMKAAAPAGPGPDRG